MPSPRGQAILDLVRHAVAHRGELGEFFRGIGAIGSFRPFAELCGLGTQISDILHGTASALAVHDLWRAALARQSCGRMVPAGKYN
jgi:hypothetical protein